MKRNIHVAVLFAAAAILLSACGHSYRFLPMYTQEGDRSVQQQPSQPPTDQSMAPAGERNDAVTQTQDATAPTDYNRNTSTGSGMQRSADPFTASESATPRSSDRQSARGVNIPPLGSSDINAMGNNSQAVAAAAPAPLSPRSSGGVPKWFLVVCAIFLPPLAVALVYGITDKFWIDLLLTFCFWIPGVIYALIVVM
jgi:uncharacterized membrane protein YqaE (UPF0057 family)